MLHRLRHALAALLTGPTALLACPMPLPTTELTIAHQRVIVEIAASPAARQCGLSARDTLAPGHGMLFVFPNAVTSPFWMRDTRVALSIAFIDDSGRILGISPMTPESLALHHPPSPYRFALELPQGWFAQHGVEPGDGLDVTSLRAH